MVFNLRPLVSGLFIFTIAHGHSLPVRPTSTTTPSLDALPLEEYLATIAPRGRGGFCNDMCAYGVDSQGKPARLDFEGHCSSFLSTTAAHTVVTVTTTSTFVVLDNNFLHRATPHEDQKIGLSTDGDHITVPTLRQSTNHIPTPRTSSNTIQTGTDGSFTIFPIHIPVTIPLHFPDCADRQYEDQHFSFTEQFSSVCSCQGVMPVTTTVETVTSTLIEQVPTAAPFKIKIQFWNETAVYLNPSIDNFMPRKSPSIKDIGFDTSGTGAQLFTLTSEGHLKSEENGTLGWIRPNYFRFSKEINGRFLLIDENCSDALRKRAEFPQFHFDHEVEHAVKDGGRYYELKPELEIRGWHFWAMALHTHNATVPVDEMLMLLGEKEMDGYKKKYDVTVEKVALLAEPDIKMDELGYVVGP